MVSRLVDVPEAAVVADASIEPVPMGLLRASTSEETDVPLRVRLTPGVGLFVNCEKAVVTVVDVPVISVTAAPLMVPFPLLVSMVLMSAALGSLTQELC